MKSAIVALAALLWVGPAMAQPAASANYSSAEVEAGAQIQLGYYASADKKCVPAQLPKVRMVEPPKVGVFTLKLGKLTTDKIAGCPKLEVGAQVAFYAAKADAAGKDHVVFEVTYGNGEVAIYDMTITIRPKAATPEKSGI